MFMFLGLFWLRHLLLALKALKRKAKFSFISQKCDEERNATLSQQHFSWFIWPDHGKVIISGFEKVS